MRGCFGSEQPKSRQEKVNAEALSTNHEKPPRRQNPRISSVRVLLCYSGFPTA